MAAFVTCLGSNKAPRKPAQRELKSVTLQRADWSSLHFLVGATLLPNQSINPAPWDASVKRWRRLISASSAPLCAPIYLMSKRRVRSTQWIVAVAGTCGDQTGDQLRSGDLVHARNHIKDSPLASPENQRTESITTLIFSNRSSSDHNSGAAFLTIIYSYTLIICPTLLI